MITQDKYRDGRSDIDLRRHLREPSAFMRTRPDDEEGEFAMNYEDGEVCRSQTGLIVCGVQTFRRVLVMGLKPSHNMASLRWLRRWKGLWKSDGSLVCGVGEF